jgi:hypothetical protein
VAFTTQAGVLLGIHFQETESTSDIFLSYDVVASWLVTSLSA